MNEITPDLTLFIDCDIDIVYERYLLRNSHQIHS